MEERFRDLNIIEYTKELKKPQVICLGFFDCIHLGHLKLINRAKTLSHKYNAEISIFTFSNNPLSFFSNQKIIYTFNERCHVLNNLELDNVLYAEFSKEFACLDREVFLNSLIGNKDIKAIIVGDDYTFGRDKSGNIEFLMAYCHKNHIALYTENLYMYNKSKLSSRNIRNLVKDGNICEINSVLSMPYIIQGVVCKGRGIGHKSLFPTANINIEDNKEKLKSGVYYTQVLIDGVRYRAVTNVGEKPTFGINAYNVETHIIYYNKDLYGKLITVEFLEKIRDIITFTSKEELREQIIKDINYVCLQSGGYDD